MNFGKIYVDIHKPNLKVEKASIGIGYKTLNANHVRDINLKWRETDSF